jgi:hypothetical protein
MNALYDGPSTFMGKRIIIIAQPMGMAWRFFEPAGCPSKRAGRRGTRGAWKRAHPQGWRWRWGKILEGKIVDTGAALLMTAEQFSALEQRLKPVGAA